MTTALDNAAVQVRRLARDLHDQAEHRPTREAWEAALAADDAARRLADAQVWIEREQQNTVASS